MEEFLKGDESVIEGWVDRFDPERADAGNEAFAALDRELIGLAKRQASLQRQIDTLYQEAGDDDLAESLTASLRTQLLTTAKRHREIAQERQERARDVSDMPEAVALFRELRRDLGARGAVLATLGYEDRREVLRLLGVEVRVFRKDAPVRFEVTGRVDLSEFAYVDAWPEPMREMDWGAPMEAGSRPRLVSSAGRRGRSAS